LKIKSNGFLYVAVTLTASTELFENSILSNLAFSIKFSRNEKEMGLIREFENPLRAQGSVSDFGVVQPLYRHLLPTHGTIAAKAPTSVGTSQIVSPSVDSSRSGQP
jgi:hypothetical protein